MTLTRRAVLVLGLGAALPACSTPPRQPGDALALVVGARANSAPPDLVDDLAAVTLDALDRDTLCTVVVADGAPVVATTFRLHSTAANPLTIERERRAALDRMRSTITACRAATAEVDQLAALALAARAVSAAPGKRRIAMIDSGLQTAGGLRFQDDGGAALSAVGEELAERLATEGFLPALDGIEVRLVGTGDVVAPQPFLGEPGRKALASIWSAIALRAGGSVVVVPSPSRSRAQAAGLPPVSVVPVAPPPPPDGPLVDPVALSDGSVGFLPDQAAFRDPAQAAGALAPYVATLTRTRQRIRLTGTTSSAGTPAGRLQLSLDRVAAVRDVLVRGGVGRDAIELRGLGSDFPGFVPDRDSSGRLDPVLAARNRQVIIELVRSSA